MTGSRLRDGQALRVSYYHGMGGSCEACKARKMSMAQILGDCITRQFQIIRGVNPQAEIFIWSDMLDPFGDLLVGEKKSKRSGPVDSREHAKSIGYSEQELAGIPEGVVCRGFGNPAALAELKEGNERLRGKIVSIAVKARK